jgi:hypothetical protein
MPLSHEFDQLIGMARLRATRYLLRSHRSMMRRTVPVYPLVGGSLRGLFNIYGCALPFYLFCFIITIKSLQINEGGFLMGKPKKQTSPRKTGLRRSHLSLTLKRKVNGLLSKAGKKVKVVTTKRETAKKKASK